MANDTFSAGLTDQDELSQFPSAVSPLTTLGLDPDMVRANPSLLQPQNPYGSSVNDPQILPKVPPGGLSMPGSYPDDAPDSASATPPPAAAAPTVSAPSTATDYGMAGLASLNQNADMATQAAQDIPTSSPEVQQLQARRNQFASPAALYDQQTGKMLDSTTEIDPKTGQPVTINPKPSIGSRIWRGVRGGLVGLATGGIPGAIVGSLEPQDIAGGTAYGAPSTAYQRAEKLRDQTLGSTDQQLSSAQANWKAAVDAAKAKTGEFRANAALGKDLTTGSTGMQNAATDASKVPILQQEADAKTQDAQNSSPEAKLQLSQKLIDQRTIQADRMNFKGTQRAMWIMNGKLPEPQQMNEAQYNSAQVSRVLNGYRQAHGGKDPQTLEDWNGVYAAAKGSLKPDVGVGDPTAPVSPQAQAVIDGRTALPPASSRAPGAQALRQEVFAHAPTYDETAFPTYKKTRESFTTGKQGDALKAINQLDGHLQSAASHIPDQSDMAAWNAFVNAGRDATGNSRTNKFDVDVNGITGEWGKLVTGGVATTEEANRVAALLGHNQSPDKLKENLGEVRELMNTAKQRLREQWQSGMPPGAVSPLSTLGPTPAKSGAINYEQFPEAQ